METRNAGLYNYGLEVEATNNVVNNGFLYGAYIKALNQPGGTTAQLYGLRCNAEAQGGSSANLTLGVWGRAVNGTTNHGLHGEASGNAGSTNCGVWATGFGKAGSTSWAVWSQGAQFSTTAGIWTTSDENLKTDIQEMTGGLETIMHLNPKTYLFRTEEFPYLQLSSELQNGLIAQEMQEVVPNLVRSVQIPAELDSIGNEVSPAMDVLAVKYEGLIPLLISAVQEQQATIAQMQDQINHCCAAQDDAAQRGSVEQGSLPVENDLQEQRLLIIPNPVADLTTLEYYVPKAGKVSLQVSTSDGKPLATLREELAEVGAYNYSWNTTKLAAGTYFCTFMLDGAVVVKRAVKVK